MLRNLNTYLTNKLILGTVQLGMPYGINNSTGKPSREEAFDILTNAERAGIKLLDTAEAYGDSESIIASYIEKHPGSFRILTKFKSNSSAENIRTQVERWKQPSNEASLYSISYHNSQDLFDGTTLKEIRALKAEGKIEKIGVSIYQNDEVEKIVDSGIIDIVQMPFNLFDNWNLRGGAIQALKKANVEVHVRSIFLQGLFFKNSDTLPSILAPLSKDLKELQESCEAYGVSVSTIALNYPLKFSEIDKVLIGLETNKQLHELLNEVGKEIPASLVEKIHNMNIKENTLLDPRNWI